MDNQVDVFQVYNHTNQKVAKIVLNGYNIEKGGPLGMHGAMRSFKVLQGDLWAAWAAQESLFLRGGSAPTTEIRVAALPAEDEGFGLIEFL